VKKSTCAFVAAVALLFAIDTEKSPAQVPPHATPRLVPPATPEAATLQTIETRAEFVRRVATEYQIRVAEQNAKAVFKELTPAKKSELKKKKIKVVLVPTVPSPQTPPKVKHVWLPYSLERESLIEPYTYESPEPLVAKTITKPKGSGPVYVGQ
jgi:hypothetical protein